MKHRMNLKPFTWAVIILLSICFACTSVYAAEKPNVLVIMSDDVGITNISAYSRGLVGYQTPNLDRIANQAAKFNVDDVMKDLYKTGAH